MTQKPTVTIKMLDTPNSGMGDKPAIVIELDPTVAPNTVRNFLHLVSQGYYNGIGFHRVIPGFMIQGGCPEGTGTGGPGYAIKGEFSGNGFANPLKHDRGVISMARTGMPDSAGSQFFIMVEESPHLDGQYAAFGKVVSGMETVDAIVAAPRDGRDNPEASMTMETVTAETFGEVYEAPETLPSRR